MEIELDPWQLEILDTEGDLAICCGRQVGKSTVIAIKAGEYAVKNKNKSIMIISAVERQALLLFEKTFAFIHDHYKAMIKTGKDKPTKHEIKLKNGSIIRCLPTGMSGHGIRGYTVDKLFADEAHYIPEDVWTAVTPMLATTGGSCVLLSTPHGREGYFYRAFQDPKFKTFHISTEEVAEMRKEPQRTSMLDHLKRERERMSKREYAQEYLGHFVDDLLQFFPDDLIKKCSIGKRRENVIKGEYYLGVDVARMGDDDSTFEILDLRNNRLEHVENQITKKTLTTETTKRILQLDKIYNFNKIYIDDGGMGVAVFDQLLNEDQTSRKVIAINNASRPIVRDESRKKKILKEDLYNNLLRLMERGEITLLDDPEVQLSLRSIQYEYVDKGGQRLLRISGNYSHIVEGLIRAAICIRDKSLNLWVRSSKNGVISIS